MVARTPLNGTLYIHWLSCCFEHGTMEKAGKIAIPNVYTIVQFQEKYYTYLTLYAVQILWLCRRLTL